MQALITQQLDFLDAPKSIREQALLTDCGLDNKTTFLVPSVQNVSVS